jgi:hypothetical protein
MLEALEVAGAAEADLEIEALGEVLLDEEMDAEEGQAAVAHIVKSITIINHNFVLFSVHFNFFKVFKT